MKARLLSSCSPTALYPTGRRWENVENNFTCDQGSSGSVYHYVFMQKSCMLGRWKESKCMKQDVLLREVGQFILVTVATAICLIIELVTEEEEYD